ncbi:MAG: hypothetical protein HY935_06615 [Nitrosomonadales bacterium]|nr:hypothetical protein [Nitrosomonadales bacterium]
MKHTALITALAILALAACENKPADKPVVPPTTTPLTPLITAPALPPGHPAKGTGGSTMPSPETPEVEKLEKATVVSTIDVPGFTYIEIQQGHQTRWLASNTTDAKKGDVIEFEGSSTLEDFKSKKLDRTFPSITFVNNVTVVKGK